jgi:plastocyanin
VKTLLAAALLLPVLAFAATHEVKIEGMQFTPATLTVKKGDKVVWRNADLVPHTATATGSFDSKTVAPGKSWTYVAGKAGSFGYVCSLHPTMKGTLVVE